MKRGLKSVSRSSTRAALVRDIVLETALCDPRRKPEEEIRYVDLSAIDKARGRIASVATLLGKDAPSRARQPLRAGDVIFATTRPNLKSAAIVPDELDGAIASTGFCVLRASEQVEPAWLFHGLYTDEFLQQLLPKMRGATYPAVGDGDVLACEIPLPNRDEQQRILERIAEAFRRLEEMAHERDAALEEAEALRRSSLDAVSECAGDETSLSSVVTIESKLVDPREAAFSSMLHIGGANIESGTGKLLALQTAGEEGLISGKFVCTPEDVIYSKIRPALRKVVRPDFIGLASADSYPLRPKATKLDRNYLFYLLLSRSLTDYALSGANRAGIPKVNREHLLAFKFPLPSLDEQRRIALTLDETWNAADQLCGELTDLAMDESALRQAILREGFAGNL